MIKKSIRAQIRSRATWVSEDEKNNIYFLGLEKKHQIQNVIHELYDGKNLSTENDDILCVMFDFSRNL